MAIEISTPEQYMAIKDWTDRGTADAPLDIVITQDLDFSQTGLTDWTGQGSNVLYANIDGQGHSIKNMVISTTVEFYLLPFLRQCSLKNLKIDNCHITSTAQIYILYFWGIHCEDFTVNGNCVFTCGYLNERGFICCPYPAAYESNFYRLGIYGKYTITNSYGSIFYGYNTNIFYGNININANILTDERLYVLNKCKTINNTFVRGNLSAGAVSVFYGIVYYCYAACVANTTGTNRFYQTGSGNIVYSSFFDNKLMQTADAEYGQPTENLQSPEWLRAQGWAI